MATFSSSVTTMEPTHTMPRSGARRVAKRFLANRVAVVATVVLLILIGSALLAPWISPYDPNVQALDLRDQGPSGQHWLGTDAFGRDILSRLLHAGRVSLSAAALATGVSAAIGVPLGLLAGYVGGRLDGLLSRVIDAVMSIPSMVLVFAIIGALGPGLTQSMAAFGVVSSPIFFRLCRAVSSELSSETFVVASRAIGCSPSRILWGHILPNISAPLLVQVSFMAGLAIIAEASLSFLGLGVSVPQASWGSMTREAFDGIYTNQWPVFPPAVIITVTILSLSLIGDGLRDALGRSRGGAE